MKDNASCRFAYQSARSSSRFFQASSIFVLLSTVNSEGGKISKSASLTEMQAISGSAPYWSKLTSQEPAIFRGSQIKPSMPL